jgi:hypothetical protein
MKEKTQISEQMKNTKFEYFFFKEVFSLNSSELNQENIDYNALEKQKLIKFMGENLKEHKIITTETVSYYDKFQEAEGFERIAKLYS